MIRFPSTSGGSPNHDGSTPISSGSGHASTAATAASFWNRKPRKTSDGSQVTITFSGTACASPLRARSSSEGLPPVPSVPRNRLNSRDIPRTYSGLYGCGNDDLLPFELNRHPARFNVVILIGIYLTMLAVVQLISMLMLTNVHDSWTLTHAMHALITLIYIHWLKGSMYDDSGEMNGLTLWEQLEATQGTRHVRETLMVLPCLLAWIACHAADYQKQHCLVNIALWSVSMLAKLPFMNGVRLFGINRTPGIDDSLFLSQNCTDDGSILGNGDGTSNSVSSTVPINISTERTEEKCLSRKVKKT